MAEASVSSRPRFRAWSVLPVLLGVTVAASACSRPPDDLVAVKPWPAPPEGLPATLVGLRGAAAMPDAPAGNGAGAPRPSATSPPPPRKAAPRRPTSASRSAFSPSASWPNFYSGSVAPPPTRNGPEAGQFRVACTGLAPAAATGQTASAEPVAASR